MDDKKMYMIGKKNLNLSILSIVTFCAGIGIFGSFFVSIDWEVFFFVLGFTLCIGWYFQIILDISTKKIIESDKVILDANI